ncbi:anti-sigma factor domain-containing protein [Clostridium sp. DJ247]|uniref:anti-sigma factor domain-containing protein n=1 Tax=Clostridium sp. DJ247 TaxID=2726188 RepID=UPI0016296765|nr:anti-sigma factor domain-containing protein [Clostridium sp. DJ247]MBC2580993.1 anti-sigma factor domain-containing protein [Clostridium sp. DJ247]
MDSKKGMVMEINKNTVYMFTHDGEFVKVKINKSKPIPCIGEEYSGIINNNIFFNTSSLKSLVAASIMFLVLLVGGGFYSYYKPVSSIVITINPALEVKANIWNRIIYIKPLNEDGKKLLGEIWLKNKKVNDAISIVLNQAKLDKFIDDNYVSTGKVVTINITGKEIDTVKLESILSNENISVNVLNNGVTIFKKDLSKDGKTINNNDYKDGVNSSKTPARDASDKEDKTNNHSNNSNNKYNENRETKAIDKTKDNYNNINTHKKTSDNEQTNKNNNQVNEKDSQDKYDNTKDNEDKNNQDKDSNTKDQSELEKKNDKKDTSNKK